MLLPNSNPSCPLLGPRMGRESGQVRAGTKTGLRLRRVPVRPGSRSSQIYSEMAEFEQEDTLSSGVNLVQ